VNKTVALIVAAGRGQRFGGEIPKQYQKLRGDPVLRHSIIALQQHPDISSVRVVIHSDDLELYQQATMDLGLGEPIRGGDFRQESVRLGLQALTSDAPHRVLIHDGARPFVSAAIIDRVLGALDNAIGAVPTVAVTDTIKRVSGDQITATEDRTTLRRAQTPQGFRFAEIVAAHQEFSGQNMTDDAAICEAMGLDVANVEGDVHNLKITTQADLGGTSTRDTIRETRTGSGFDVHRFGPGTEVMLCGVSVPHSSALEGHSDADVGLHALTDALLGALGEGDIGHFFPPSDERWRGVASDQFVEYAVNLIKQLSGEIINVDITLICEAPKIGPHRIAMKERVANILGVSPARVNVKATTTERLGFTGRREGIAAQAIANIALPTTE